MLAFGVGVALAAAAGALLAPDFLVYPENGAISTFKGFEIIVIGGLGSLLGSIVGGVLLGVIEALGSVFLSARLQGPLRLRAPAPPPAGLPPDGPLRRARAHGLSAAHGNCPTLPTGVGARSIPKPGSTWPDAALGLRRARPDRLGSPVLPPSPAGRKAPCALAPGAQEL